MDAGAFDGLARRFGARWSRRDGLKAALAALAGGAAARLGIGEADAKRRGRGDDRGNGNGSGSGPWPAGPGGPKRKDNVCKRDRDCCTGYCRTRRGATAGNCRCVKVGAACKAGQQCCSGSVCFKGSCVRNQPAKICAVCASGCAHTSVNAAYAAAAPGATIAIGAGTWPTGIEVTKSMRIIACEGADEVILTPDGSVTDSYALPAIIVEKSGDTTPYTITLDGLTFKGSGKDNGESLIYAPYGGSVSFRVLNCAFSDAYTGLNIGDGAHTVQGSTFTASVYGASVSLYDGTIAVTGSTFNGCDTYGFYALGNQEVADRAKSVFTYTDCEFNSNGDAGLVQYGGSGVADGCTITGNGGGGAVATWGDLTLKDTTVSGNTDDSYGGGASVYAGSYNGQGYDASLTLAGSTVITGNTAPEGSGIAVQTDGVLTGAVTGASDSNVYGNLSGDQCDFNDGSSWTQVPNCAF
ncbi:MAG: right-handed parallel beta-helix repeat-containing protein [Chloroflexota bacterium]